jgi:hypothetical protein
MKGNDNARRKNNQGSGTVPMVDDDHRKPADGGQLLFLRCIVPAEIDSPGAPEFQFE